jgi:membrane-associated phospholipid phosphatase
MQTIQELNIYVFTFFNKTFGLQTFDKTMILADKFGGPHIFHYHLLLITIVAAIMTYCTKDNKTNLKELFILGCVAMCTLFMAIIINLVVITESLKTIISSTRPYCELEYIYILSEITNSKSCDRGFPSGHVAFSLSMIISFWPIFNTAFKTTSIIIFIIIAITRMSSGAHYPLDILGAISFCLPITIYIRTKTNYFVRKLENRWKAFDYIYSKTLNQK